MAEFFLFVLGLALGSFLHVLASRYDPDRFLFSSHTLGGRSYCPHCHKVLAWYELVPLVSFLTQRGRCRACGAQIGWSYLWVELASGFITALVPLHILWEPFAFGAHPFALATVWTAAFLVMLLMTLIDVRLQIIPDELVIILTVLGIGALGLVGGAMVWSGHLVAGLGTALFFGLLIFATRGRGMGVGDAKLGFALGLLFGWPAIILLLVLAFVIGAAVGVVLIMRRAKTLKSALPFGPFLALAALVVFFFGQTIIQSWYNLMV